MTEAAAQPEMIDIETIERYAGEVLAEVPPWLWDGKTLPIPVEEIVDSCFNLHVRDVEDLTQAPNCPDVTPSSLSGLLLASRGEIWVNAAEAREWPPRRRFTIGHELGHWVMHRSNQQSLFCRKVTVLPDQEGPAEADTADAPSEGKPPLPVPEAEANAFAAALLMPGDLMRHHYSDSGGDFHQMCQRFSSSEAAMGRRLHQTIPRSG